jgi:hypothetical protein
MNGWFEFIEFFTLDFPVIVAQGSQGKLPFDPYKTTQVTPEFLIYLLAAIVSITLAILFGVYRYNRWQKFKEFETEMKSLDLENEQEGALSEMVKRYSMDQPISILYSARLFDEMASVEIKRILSSSASAEQKQDYIDKVYSIRAKTYHPDWLPSESPPKKTEGLPESTV